jgi:PTH1 family peptidyl-tRNA hydrolase
MNIDDLMIVGLGNFGEKYKNNRHNAGFLLLDFLLDGLKRSQLLNNLEIKSNFDFTEEKKFFGFINQIKLHNNQRIFLLKPKTYMNLSGKSVLALKNFYKIDLKNIIVIHDELDFPKFKVKFKNGGGAGGHNGLKSIDLCLASNQYLRLRIGIDKPENKDYEISSYVLSDLSDSEIKFLKNISDFLLQKNHLIDLFSSNDSKRQKVFQDISSLKFLI